MSWGQYDNPSECFEAFQAVLQKRRKTPTIKYVHQLPSELQQAASSNLNPAKKLKLADDSGKPKHVLTYSCEQDIMEAYRAHNVVELFASQQNSARAPEEEAEETVVYIPHDIMQVPVSDKQILPEHNLPYNIVFYKNEFKRIVTWHLSQLHHVVFYKSSQQ
jgi:hypothetical protein